MTRIEKVLEPGAAMLRGTPGQTIGPFFKFGLQYEGDNRIVEPHSPGSVFLQGYVYDGNGFAIPDALVEIWAADSDGTIPAERGSRNRDGFAFTGFGRSATADDGRFHFWTRNPGPIDGKAPFFAVAVFARGLPNVLRTRIYLPDDEAALAADPLLSSLTAEERATLVATRADDGSLRHDVHVQGEKETVFLAY
jgi:protocatechuate 3,4-dioxygenase alpha subunit